MKSGSEHHVTVLVSGLIQGLMRAGGAHILV